MTAGRMARAIEKERRAGTYHEPKQEDPKQDARWHEAQKNLRCMYYDCEWFLDALPDLVCTKGGKHRSLLSLPDSEELADICPYSGKSGKKIAQYNARLLK